MKKIINISRESIKIGRKRAAELSRNIWRYRENSSYNASVETTHVDISKEMTDFLTDLRPMTSTPHRRLRSHGPAPDVPRVQASILEYKKRAS